MPELSLREDQERSSQHLPGFQEGFGDLCGQITALHRPVLPVQSIHYGYQGSAPHQHRIARSPLTIMADGISSTAPSSASSPVLASMLTDTDSAGRSTPMSSRQPSVVMERTPYTRPRPGLSSKSARRSSLDDDAEFYCEDCDHWDCGDKNHKKRAKERKARKELADVMRCDEVVCKLYILLTSGNQQSAGNGQQAGLEYVKNNVARWTSAIFAYLVETGYKNALREGRLEQWQEELRQVGKAAEQTGQTRPSWLASLDGQSIELCDHIARPPKGSKRPREDPEIYRRCTVHGHEDWCKCREEICVAAFEEHRNTYVAELQRERAAQRRKLSPVSQSPSTKPRL